MLTKQKDR